MATDTKACTSCGKQFKKSPNDSTVKCPDCRHGGKVLKTFRKGYPAIKCSRCGHSHTTLKCDNCGY